MLIGVVRETAPHERRVALVPQSVERLTAGGHAIVVEACAGLAAGFPDQAYTGAGARIADRSVVLGESDLVLTVQCPQPDDLRLTRTGTVVIGLVGSRREALAGAAAARNLILLAMELVPRVTKAQVMDVLSSQATIAGYQAVLLGASHLARLLPMLTTAAGTIPPGKAFIIGAGVAGLQAIATARRLGAVVSAFDVRPAVREQVKSLGATFVETDAVSAAAEGAGGYARELAADQQQAVLQTVARHLPDMDLVIATAQIPGKPAPRLITRSMVASMKPGSVIVDLAVESGGNCEASRSGETIVESGITILGPLNLPSQIPQHASVMYSRNVQALVDYGVREGRFVADRDEPILGPMRI